MIKSQSQLGAVIRRNNRRKADQMPFLDKVSAAFTLVKRQNGRTVLNGRNILGVFLGLVKSGICPIGVFLFAHVAAPVTDVITGQLAFQPIFGLWWFIALGGLFFSFPSVFQAMNEAFGCKWKAGGATVLIELSMIFAPSKMWLYSATCLGVLLFINWIFASVKLVRG